MTRLYMARIYNREKAVFSTNGTGTGHLHAKEKMNLDTDLQLSQKLTQNGS